MKKLFDVMLAHVADAVIFLDYQTTFYKLLEKNQSISSPKVWFVQDMRYACLTTSVQALIKLYDTTKGSVGLIRLLNELKNDSFKNTMIDPSMIPQDLDDIKKHEHLTNKLKMIRNKKQFHIDPENARGIWDGKPYELKIEDLDTLVKLAIKIISHYGAAFGIEINQYITMPQASHGIISVLEGICFPQEAETA